MKKYYQDSDVKVCFQAKSSMDAALEAMYTWRYAGFGGVYNRKISMLCPTNLVMENVMIVHLCEFFLFYCFKVL